MIKDVFICWNKDFKFYFQSKMIYLVLFIYGTMITALTLYASNFVNYSSVNMYQFFRYQPGVLAMIIPALTMRAWADEYKHNTLEILLSQPIDLWAIVIGKFLAAWSVVGIMILMSCGVWLELILVLPLDSGWIAINYAATLLMAGSLCAMASMMSAICYNMIGAFLSSLAVCMLMVTANWSGWVNKILPDNWSVAKVLTAFDFNEQFNKIIMGQVDVATLIYFMLIIGFALWIERVGIEYKRR